MATKKQVYYNAKGYILGNMWGGGKGYYETKKYNYYKSKKKLIEEIKKDFKKGSLDSGFGFKDLIGAIMYIERVEVREINNKQFINKKITKYKLGKISENKLMSTLGIR